MSDSLFSPGGLWRASTLADRGLVVLLLAGALALGLAPMMETVFNRSVRMAVFIALVLSVWNFGLMAQYALRMIDREEDLTYREVLVNQARVPVEIIRKAGNVIRRSDVESPSDSTAEEDG